MSCAAAAASPSPKRVANTIHIRIYRLIHILIHILIRIQRQPYYRWPQFVVLSEAAADVLFVHI